MKTNRNGFLRRDGKELVETSVHSALSGVSLGSGFYTYPVPGRPDLRFRVTATEAVSLNDEQVERIVARARELYPLKTKQVKLAPEKPAQGDE